MATINVYFGFYPKNAVKNPNLFNFASSIAYYDTDASSGVTLNSPQEIVLSAGDPAWGPSQSASIYTGLYSVDSSNPLKSTMLLGAISDTNYTIDILFGNGPTSSTFNNLYSTLTLGDIDEAGWSAFKITDETGDFGFTLSYAGVSAPTFIPYILYDMNGLTGNKFQFLVDSTQLSLQTVSFSIGLVVPPVKFEMVGIQSSEGTAVDISEFSEGGYYTEGFENNVITAGAMTSLPIFTGKGYGANLAQSVLISGSVTTDVFTPAGLLLFAGISTSVNTSDACDFIFSVGGRIIKFPVPVNITSAYWNSSIRNGYGGYFNVLQLQYTYDPLHVSTVFPAIQINIDPIDNFKIEVTQDPDYSENAIGLQGMQFATTSPIPVCLAKDCTVWTSLGLEKIQDLKSGCQLVAVDIEGNEFLAKFDIFQQTRRGGLIDICRHEPDVIVSHRHTILYPDSEIKDFKCPKCKKSKPYTNQLNKQSCHHCHIFNVKNHTPILSKDFLPIEKAETTLYHVIPEDLVNVKGFKVGERRVLISEITTSEIQLLMSGFVKV